MYKRVFFFLPLPFTLHLIPTFKPLVTPVVLSRNPDKWQLVTS